MVKLTELAVTFVDCPCGLPGASLVFRNVKVVDLVGSRFFVGNYPFHGFGKIVGYLWYLSPKITNVQVFKVYEIHYLLNMIRRIIK